MPQSEDKPKANPASLPAVWGVIASAVVAGTLLTASIRQGSVAEHAPIVLIGAVSSAAAVSALAALRARALLMGLTVGIGIGLFSAYELLSQPVRDPFTPVAATLGFFTLVGFAIGAIVEFASYVHRIAHQKGDRPQSG